MADALTSMQMPENWQETGSVGIGDAVSAAADMFNSWRLMVGVIFPFAGNTVPDGTLECDGSECLQSDYPLLYALIGSTYGSASSGYFRLPDLRGRSPIGAGQGGGLSDRALGDALGEETHTLTSSEMPTHSHSMDGVFPGLAFAPGELPVETPLGFSVNTGDTGGGGSHNNMQPSLAIRFVIVAG